MPWESMATDHRELEKELEPFSSSTTYSERGKPNMQY